MDVLDEFQLSGARSHDEPLHCGLQRFNDMMEECLVFRRTMAGQASGAMVEMGVRIGRRQIKLHDVVTIEKENSGLAVIQPHYGVIVLH